MKVVLLIATGLTTSLTACDRSPDAAAPATQPMTQSIAIDEPATQPAARKIVAGDVLQITIQDLVKPGSATTKSVRVNDAGEVHPPMTKSVRVVGLTTTDAASLVQKEAAGKATVIEYAN